MIMSDKDINLEIDIILDIDADVDVLLINHHNNDMFGKYLLTIFRQYSTIL